MKEGKKLVRLYPTNRRLGWVMRSFTSTIYGLVFKASRGWYIVDAEVAEYLREIPQESRYPEGKKAFAIADSEAEAEKIDDKIARVLREDKKQDAVGTVTAPVEAAPTKKAKRPGQKSGRSMQAGDEGEGKPRTRKKRAS